MSREKGLHEGNLAFRLDTITLDHDSKWFVFSLGSELLIQHLEGGSYPISVFIDKYCPLVTFEVSESLTGPDCSRWNQIGSGPTLIPE